MPAWQLRQTENTLFGKLIALEPRTLIAYPSKEFESLFDMAMSHPGVAFTVHKMPEMPISLLPPSLRFAPYPTRKLL
jgi:hypothetical protein